MAFVLLLGFVLGTLVLTARLARRGLPFIFLLHLILMSLMLGVHELLSLLVGEEQFRSGTLLLQILLLGLYVGLIAIIGLHAKRSHVVDAMDRVPPSWLTAAMLAGLALKVYLVGTYGVPGLAVLRDREVADISSLEVIADTLLFYPAVGAFWLTTIRLGRGRAGLGLGLLWGLFWLWPLVGFGEFGGGRRFAIATFVLLGLAAWSRRSYRVAARAGVMMAALALLVLALAAYFQAIRTNLDDPHLEELLAAGDVSTALIFYFTPPPRAAEQLYRNLAERISPVRLLYELTAIQLEHRQTASGRLILASLENAVPRLFLPTKEFVNADDVLATVFGFPFTDLPTSIIAAGQAELLWAAYLVVPVIIGVLLLGYSRLFQWAVGSAPLLAMATWAVLVRHAVMIEEGPDLLFSDARHLAVIAGLSGLGYVARSILRRRPSIVLGTAQPGTYPVTRAYPGARP